MIHTKNYVLFLTEPAHITKINTNNKGNKKSDFDLIKFNRLLADLMDDGCFILNKKSMFIVKLQ